MTIATGRCRHTHTHTGAAPAGRRVHAACMQAATVTCTSPRRLTASSGRRRRRPCSRRTRCASSAIPRRRCCGMGLAVNTSLLGAATPPCQVRACVRACVRRGGRATGWAVHTVPRSCRSSVGQCQVCVLAPLRCRQHHVGLRRRLPQPAASAAHKQQHQRTGRLRCECNGGSDAWCVHQQNSHEGSSTATCTAPHDLDATKALCTAPHDHDACRLP